MMHRAQWTRCPACVQQKTGEAYGRIVASGDFIAGHLEEIRRRIRNVARQAESKQALRRIVSTNYDGDQLEVLTTSQKLAHRVARELEKAFGGETTYSWWDRDGTLYATWRR
jgi:NMD protein affecting ribosome stability and mRNA decay